MKKEFLTKPPSIYFAETETDKIGSRHDYCDFYNMIFASLLFQIGAPLSVLEIGVSRFGEGSGHAFSRMPFVKQFVGIDIKDICTDFEEKGVFISADAYSPTGVQCAARYALII